jgi:LuxR family maltose regulon positive regulatory protein
MTAEKQELTTRKTYSERNRTQLFRPPPIDDYVPRKNVESLLGDERKHPIIVVSAPAGYGKTTQISQWIVQSGAHCAWISLDKSHNDLSVFLQSFASCLDDWSPSAADTLRKILKVPTLPPTNLIADEISVEMDGSTDELILVLDDFHEIHDSSIHRFVESLLMRMPRSLRVAIVSRRTPPIALSRLRSQNLVLDIRLQDLQFDRGSTQALVKSHTGKDVDGQLLDKLEKIAEGWPAGLRMLLLARARDTDMHTYISQFKGQVWQIQEYLIEEVLRQLPPDVAKNIGITAILGRFSSGLCETLIGSTEDSGVSGRQFIELIRNKGLFCIPLDESGEWYRYHPLFRELLLRQIRSRYSEPELHQFHSRAATWLDSEGQIEEAVQHFILAEEFERAADVVLHHRDSLTLTHQWRRLDRLLNSLPSETIENNLELLMLLSWSSGRLGRVNREIELATEVRNRIDNARQDETIDDAVNGQSYAQYSVVDYYWGNGQAAVASAEKALALLPQSYNFARAEGTMMLGPSLQMTGKAADGRRALLESLERPGSDSDQMRARTLMGCCYLSWADGDLRELKSYAMTLLELGQANDDAHAVVHACWFGGAALYQFNEMDAAEDIVKNVLAEKWWPHHPSYSYCVEIQSMIHSARGEHSAAFEIIEELIAQALESRATSHISYLHALRARLALASGDIATASDWAQEFEAGTVTAGYEFLVPALLAARILLQSEQPEGQEKVGRLLEDHQQFYESTNNKRFLIETLALRAMWCARTGNDESVEPLLRRAVTVAKPGGFVRVFVDQGPDIIPLLNRLQLDEQQLTYVGTILAGFTNNIDKQQSDKPDATQFQDNAGLAEALSKREKEVLELLAVRLTNKEIGERLFIAPETVKRHAHNIFEKLNVNSRQAARAKAIGLGLVSG